MTKEKPLVSIISPCYNGENYVTAFLESLLVQDYNHFEVIFVNDGSKDQTESIVKNYENKFDERNIKFTYLYQENAGQAQAVNNALKYVQGEYLSWVDSDDILHSNYLSRKVAFMEENKNLTMVISPVNVVEEGKLDQVIKVLRRKQNKNDSLILDMISFKNVFYPPGGYMVRSEAFFNMYPDRTIIDSREGQNIQMMLPMAYLGSYGYIDEPLYDYVIHDTSHSHQKRSYEDTVTRVNNISNLMDAVLMGLSIDEKDKCKYHELIRKELNRRLFYVAKSFNQKIEMKKYYCNMKKEKMLTLMDRAIYFKAKIIH